MPPDGRAAVDYSRQRDHRRREWDLLALAAQQHGVVSYEQLLRLGFSPENVHYRVARGRLHRLYRGVYAVGRPDVTVQGHRLAAVMACGDGAVLSHASAAAHHGLRSSASAWTDVTVPRRGHRRHRGVRVHRRTTLIEEDTIVVDAIPCTSVARTLLDLASLRFIDDRALERAIERAEILEIYDHRAIERLLARAVGQPGSRRLAIAVGIARPGETVTASGLEERLLALCRRWGLPEPEVNAEILLGGERARVDFLWRKRRVVVETDSFKYHKSQAAFRRDRRRDRLLELEGYRHARFADRDFDTGEAEIERTLRGLLHVQAPRPDRRRSTDR